MTALTPIPRLSLSLPSLIDRAAMMLSGAKNAAEVLEAREVAGLAYDVAKRAARLQRAKSAHDDLIAAAHRAQADALEIEAAAKRRLADEYDGAQARGDVGQQGARRDLVRAENEVVASAADLGLNRREIHEARQLRDAETSDPGIVRRTLDDRLENGEEPTRTALRRMVTDAAMRGLRPQRSPKDTGTIRFEDGGVIVIADLAKRIDWDQAKLAQIAENIASSGEDPSEFIETRLKVSERKYTALPESWRKGFEPARTVRTGKPKFRFELSGGAA